MNRAQIERKLIEQIRDLPDRAALEVLDFARFLARKPDQAEKRSRRLGILSGKASYGMKDDFAMSDEELLNS